MKAATKKATKQLIIIAKYTFKKNGAVVYRVRSSEPNKKGRIEGTDQVERNGLWYDAHNVSVYQNETVCGCTCKGSEYKGKCFHRDGIQVLLDTPKQVQLPAGIAAINGTLRVKGPALAKREDISTKGALTTNRGYSLLKVS